MTASIIAFPDIHERNNREFDRTGSTTYTRAVEEAHDLGGLAHPNAHDWPALLERIAALGTAITGLATWRDEVDWVLPIELHCGRLEYVPLRDAPRFLRSRMGARAASTA